MIGAVLGHHDVKTTSRYGRLEARQLRDVIEMRPKGKDATAKPHIR